MRTLSTAVAVIAIATVIGIGSADAVTKPSNLNRIFAGGTQLTGEVAANSTLTVDGDLKPAAIVPAAATQLTIASGVITVTQMLHTVETQSAASSDDLDTINGLADGEIAILRPASDSHDVVLKHATGNIECPGAADITMAEDDDAVIIQRLGSKVSVIGRKIKAETGGGTPSDGSVTTAKIAAANVTGPKIASTFIQPFAILGLDLSGGGAVATNIPCTGAQVGDVVAFITKVTGVGPIVLGTSDFETTITTAGQLKQTSLTDLNGVQYFGFLLKRN